MPTTLRCPKQLLLLLMLLLYACEGKLEQESPKSAPEEVVLDQPVALSLEPYAGRLRQLQVRVGTETHPFLFDTGGGLTLIDPEITNLINCEPYGRLTGFRMSGEQVEFQQCGRAQLQVGSLAIEQDIGVFDLMALLPEELPPLRGVISLHTFQDHAITLDLAGKQLIVETEISLQERVRDMHEMSMQIERDVEGRGFGVYLEAKAQKGSLWLLLDSGNLAGFILAPHAIEQLGLDWPPLDAEPDGADGNEIPLDLVGLGPVQVPVIIQEIRHDGAISAAFMEKLTLTMDFGTGRIWGQMR